MNALSRRGFLASAAGLAGLAAVGALSGCAPRTASISPDPAVLTMWYWSKAATDKLLGPARKNIQGTKRRLRTDLVGGNFDAKLRTSLAGKAYIPDVTMINSNVSSYFPIEEQFINLNDLGAKRFANNFLDWKLQLGVTDSGAQRFWPADTGPTSQFYRRDIFEKARLPSEPAALSALYKNWDAWLDSAMQLKKNTKASMISNVQQLFTQLLGASKDRYFTKDGTAIYEASDSAVRQAWDITVKASRAGITAKAYTDGEKNAGYSSGRLAANIEAVWWSPTLKSLAPKQKGLWGVARQPGPAGNNGGSFFAVPKASKDPQAAFDFISWITSPENQAVAFDDIQLFPSTPGTFDLVGTEAPDAFYAGQSVVKAFSKAAEQIPITFISPYETQVSDGVIRELTNIETQGKDPDRAWNDAMAQAKRQLAKKGLLG
ncbi:extracellular solute-binding protein [Glaciihabitans sp. UYNi722]|uniref:ABC transporter substrate-binding protein n=1 Tax=Glaciihabitans sp. UYNi722 TaxID=3156344 RepID=UPI00339A45E7